MVMHDAERALEQRFLSISLNVDARPAYPCPVVLPLLRPGRSLENPMILLVDGLRAVGGSVFTEIFDLRSMPEDIWVRLQM